MTTHRLFPATNGPDTPATYAGEIVSGVIIALNGGGNWLDGYWYWCCPTGQPTTPVKAALWCLSSSTDADLIPDSVVTSGTLAAGQWNWIPLPAPIQLAATYNPGNTQAGGAYVAAIGGAGNFPDSSNAWSTTYAAGITNGPLVAYSNNSGTLKGPYSMGNGVLSTASSDPETTCPLTQNADNLWVDVQISDTPPAGYTGSYRLWPNLPTPNASVTLDDSQLYDGATQVNVTARSTANAVWVYSPPGAATLPTKCEVWDIATQATVATIAAPSWKTAAGAAAAPGGKWVRAAFPAGVTIPAGSYRVSAYYGGGGASLAKDASSGYWTTGAGSGGITNGPVSAPALADAAQASVYGGAGTTNGQGVFAVGDAYPNETTGAAPSQCYFIDLEVTPDGTPDAAPLLLVAGLV